MLRVVSVRDGHDVVVIRPDPRHRMPGRGAWLHPTPQCFELAVRRKAFARALHVPAPVDLGEVARHLGVEHS